MSLSPRVIIFLVAALLSVGGTVYFARSWLDSERAAIQATSKKPPVKPVTKTYVLVAKVNLPAGTLIKPKHIAWQAWPGANLHPSYIRRRGFKPGSINGAVIRRGIAAGQPIATTIIVRPNERGFMAAVLNPGSRAVSLRVNAVTGVSGFVFPGDRVDIILTHRLAGEGKKRQTASETLLTDVRVLAIDQNPNDQVKKPAVAKTVTLEVTPKQAEMLAVAGKLGSLSLTLRSLKRKGRTLTGIVTSGVVLDLDKIAARPPVRSRSRTVDSEIIRPPRALANTVVVTVMRGGKRTTLTFAKAPR